MRGYNQSCVMKIKNRYPVRRRCWKVQDLIMDGGDMISEDLRPEKRKREEISRGWRKHRQRRISEAIKENIL